MTERLVANLRDLGFSTYEARCYAGLLGGGPQTGYAVAKSTGVPQPKVYEALRKLVTRGAARQLTGVPTRFVAERPDVLFDRMADEYAASIADARDASGQLAAVPPGLVELLPQLTTWPEIQTAAVGALLGTSRSARLSGTPTELAGLEHPLRAARSRGVDVTVLHSGEPPFPLEGARLIRRARPDEPPRRHLAVIADSRELVWAVSRNGHQWSGLTSRNALLITAARGCLQHDAELRRILTDLGPELYRLYGPDLRGLSDTPTAVHPVPSPGTTPFDAPVP
ncbi:helix-turn-helix domain-containing protein [Actinoplanes sp. NPDC051851]|uniref:TrmB family transcriptional regulator n=1 Tax=Actinoplanes sp. NPDC051851 TaxID=3154753 RepID=UPI00341822BD